jgi:hypothetical protein
VSVYEAPVKALHGDPASLGDYRGEALLIVNVASRCGNPPQYAQLEELQHRYGDKGFTGGEIVPRFSLDTLADAPEVVVAIEALLPA